MNRCLAASALVMLGATAPLALTSHPTPVSPPAVVAPAVGAPAARAPAVPFGGNDCSNKTLKGTWGLTIQGNILAPIGTIQPAAFSLVATVTGDGVGGFLASGKANIGGVAITSPATGGYSVKSDCTGTATFHYPGGWSLDVFYVISGDGDDRTLWIVNTSQPVVSHGTARKISN